MKTHDTTSDAPTFRSGVDPEKVSCHVFQHAGDASIYVANQIADLIRQRAEVGKMCVLGLATGSTPVSAYNELVRMHQQDGLSFQNVVTFNLDEYFPMQPEALQSYVRFMREHLFDHLDILSDFLSISRSRS
jgi:glucosamine-6-phosphate deaminase